WPRKITTTMRPITIRTRCFFSASTTAHPCPLVMPRLPASAERRPRRETKAGNRRVTPISGPGDPASPACWATSRSCPPRLLFQEKLHLHAGELDHVVVVQLVRLRIQRLAVHHREITAFDVRYEIALGAARDDRHLDAGLAQRREVLGELQLLAHARPGEDLDRGEQAVPG